MFVVFARGHARRPELEGVLVRHVKGVERRVVVLNIIIII